MDLIHRAARKAPPPRKAAPVDLAAAAARSAAARAPEPEPEPYREAPQPAARAEGRSPEPRRGAAPGQTQAPQRDKGEGGIDFSVFAAPPRKAAEANQRDDIAKAMGDGGESSAPGRKKPKDADRRSRDFAMNLARLKKFGFITPSARRSRTSEEFRLIKRRLMQRMTLSTKTKEGRAAHGARRRRGREHVIVVTSSRPSEGKSFIAMNLALSIMLDEGFNVLLVDGDVARPSLSRIFGLRSDLPGLTDLLTGAADSLSDVLLREEKYPLTFLAAGGAVDSATNLFGSERMHDLIEDMSSRYTDRIIIIDAPPLLASTEPVALAQHAGQILLVIDAERTSRSAVDAALDLLPPDQNINLVLNKSASRSGAEQFGSYYEAYTQSPV